MELEFHYTRSGMGIIDAVCRMFSGGTFLLRDGDKLRPVQDAYVACKRAREQKDSQADADRYARRGQGIVDAVCRMFSEDTFHLGEGDALLPVQEAYVAYRKANEEQDSRVEPRCG